MNKPPEDPTMSSIGHDEGAFSPNAERIGDSSIYDEPTEEERRARLKIKQNERTCQKEAEDELRKGMLDELRKK